MNGSEALKQAQKNLQILSRLEKITEKNSKSISELNRIINQQSSQIERLIAMVEGDNGTGISDHVRDWIRFRKWWDKEKIGDEILLNTVMRGNLSKAFWLFVTVIITNIGLIGALIVAIFKYIQ